MARAFYNYTLMILEKVSFDAELFRKELEKAYQSFLPNERLELKMWLSKFLIKHPTLKNELINSEEFEGQSLLRVG